MERIRRQRESIEAQAAQAKAMPAGPEREAALARVAYRRESRGDAGVYNPATGERYTSYEKQQRFIANPDISTPSTN